MELSTRVKALDENMASDSFLMKLLGIVTEEEVGKLKKNEEQEKNFKCVNCGEPIPLDIYGISRLIISNARHNKIICAECERNHYMPDGIYKISNQKYKEAALNVLT